MVHVWVNRFVASLLSNTIRVSGLVFRSKGRLFLIAKLRSKNWVEDPSATDLHLNAVQGLTH